MKEDDNNKKRRASQSEREKSGNNGAGSGPGSGHARYDYIGEAALENAIRVEKRLPARAILIEYLKTLPPGSTHRRSQIANDLSAKHGREPQTYLGAFSGIPFEFGDPNFEPILKGKRPTGWIRMLEPRAPVEIGDRAVHSFLKRAVQLRNMVPALPFADQEIIREFWAAVDERYDLTGAADNQDNEPDDNDGNVPPVAA